MDLLIKPVILDNVAWKIRDKVEERGRIKRLHGLPDFTPETLCSEIQELEQHEQLNPARRHVNSVQEVEPTPVKLNQLSGSAAYPSEQIESHLTTIEAQQAQIDAIMQNPVFVNAVNEIRSRNSSVPKKDKDRGRSATRRSNPEKGKSGSGKSSGKNSGRSSSRGSYVASKDRKYVFNKKTHKTYRTMSPGDPAKSNRPQRSGSAPRSSRIDIKALGVEPGECFVCGIPGHYCNDKEKCALSRTPFTKEACTHCHKGAHLAEYCPRKINPSK